MKIFNNKLHVEPGTAVKLITNIAPTPNLLSTGIVAVIGESDGGLTYQDGVMYESDQPNYLKNILRGGVSQRCINFIFNPSKDSPGAQRVVFVRAQAATSATVTIEQSTGGNVDFTMTTKDKGAYLSDSTNGLKWRLIAGVVDNAKEILLLQLNGETIFTSPEVGTYQELINAIEADAVANSLITAAVTDGSASTNIDASVRTGAFAVMAGGTSPAMTGTDVDGALELLATKFVNYIFIASETDSLHAKVLSFCNNLAEYKVSAFFGGAANETISQVSARALALNNQRATLCYPDVIVPSETTLESETLSPMYHAALIVGLRAGLTPYIPLTYKTINVLGFSANEGNLSRSQREELIRNGVLYSRLIDGVGFAVNKGVNTLQNNSSIFFKLPNGEAASPEISIVSIANQIINELEISSRLLFVGGTAATVTKEDVINFTKNYLKVRCSTVNEPNLINNFQNVTAELQEDAWFVYFGFTPNTPINFVFFTGAMLRP